MWFWEQNPHILSDNKSLGKKHSKESGMKILSPGNAYGCKFPSKKPAWTASWLQAIKTTTGSVQTPGSTKIWIVLLLRDQSY